MARRKKNRQPPRRSVQDDRRRNNNARAEPLRIPLRLFGKRFGFDLFWRMLDLGPAGQVPYYWIDPRTLRRLGSTNYRSCVDLWWAAVGSPTKRPADNDPNRKDVYHNQQNLVLAELYAFVCRSKGQQKIFLDALPRDPLRRRSDHRISTWASAFRKDMPPPPHQKKSSAERRDVRAMAREIKVLLTRDLPLQGQRESILHVFRVCIADGITALWQGGRRGLQRYIEKELLPILNQHRKRGNHPTGRQFANTMVYEAKTAFYACYSRIWGGLIPWLKVNRDLSAASENLLRLWHFQNPRGRGPSVLWGQVLALHPVTAIMMINAAHRRALGEYLSSIPADYLDRDLDEFNRKNPAYWKLADAILRAFYEYQERHETGELKRPRLGKTRIAPTTRRDRARSSVGQERANYPERSEASILEDQVARHKLRCSKCKDHRLKYVSYEILDEKSQRIRVFFACEECNHITHLDVSRRDLLYEEP